MSVKTVRDSRSLLVQFPFYDHTKASKSRVSLQLQYLTVIFQRCLASNLHATNQPASLIGHFIGHEGPTSLFSELAGCR